MILIFWLLMLFLMFTNDSITVADYVFNIHSRSKIWMQNLYIMLELKRDCWSIDNSHQSTRAFFTKKKTRRAAILGEQNGRFVLRHIDINDVLEHLSNDPERHRPFGNLIDKHFANWLWVANCSRVFILIYEREIVFNHFALLYG